MAEEWTEDDEVLGEEDDDPGFLGGGGPASVLGLGDDEALDEAGDNLARVDEEDVERSLDEDDDSL